VQRAEDEQRGTSSPAWVYWDGVIDWSRSGNWPDAWSCLAYESRSVLGATTCLMVRPGAVFWAVFWALAIEVCQKAGVSDGLLKVR
jgi:hypothetical protein